MFGGRWRFGIRKSLGFGLRSRVHIVCCASTFLYKALWRLCNLLNCILSPPVIYVQFGEGLAGRKKLNSKSQSLQRRQWCSRAPQYDRTRREGGGMVSISYAIQELAHPFENPGTAAFFEYGDLGSNDWSITITER